VKVTEKEIGEVVEDLKKHFKEWKDVEREVQKGDRVETDFEGFEPPKKGDKDELKSIPNTASKNHPIMVGENIMVPGFEDALIGMKKDEKKEFEVTFPKEYHNKDFQGKKVLFKAEVKRIEAGEDQDLNEALVEKVTGQKMSVEDFKKDIEKNVKAQKEQKAEQGRETKYLEELLKRAELDVPEPMVEEELDYIIKDMQQDLAQKGMTLEKFLEQTKMKMEDLRKKYHEEAERRIKTRLALTHVIDAENVGVTDKELEDEITKMVGFYPEEQREKMREEMTQGDEKFKLKNRILLKKFFDKVLG